MMGIKLECIYKNQIVKDQENITTLFNSSDKTLSKSENNDSDDEDEDLDRKVELAQLKPGVNERVPSLIVKGDQRRFQQVLINI